jgi:hypothetical protein
MTIKFYLRKPKDLRKVVRVKRLWYAKQRITHVAIDDDIELQPNVSRRQSMKKNALKLGVLGALLATASMSMAANIGVARYDTVVNGSECAGCSTPGTPSGSYVVKYNNSTRGRAEARWNSVDASGTARFSGKASLTGGAKNVSLLQVFKDGGKPAIMLAVKNTDGNGAEVYDEIASGKPSCGTFSSSNTLSASIVKGTLEIKNGSKSCGKITGVKGKYYFKHGIYHTNSGTGNGTAKWSGVSATK